MIRDNQNKYNQLRNEYNVFVYERFDYVLNKDNIKINYTFNLDDKFQFFPEIVIHIDENQRNSLSSSYLDNLVFHIGMVELVSYWKVSCAPQIIIKPYLLNKDQINFWKKLYFNGLGEFYYLNSIKAEIDDFVNISSDSEKSFSSGSCDYDPQKVLVPVGGGKDSIVTLELLKNEFELIPFIINPRPASIDSAVIAGFSEEDIVKVSRTIHPKLIELNQLGFLNGHTPFSAVLAFITLLISSLKEIQFIALSNESSANEPTVVNGPNHQYSKSVEFEHDFRTYSTKYINEELVYFSFLRPLSEYKIAQLFSGYSSHFWTFKSCNVGSKVDSWCGSCPKCLFTAIILSPFLSPETIVNIFNKNILDDKKLLSIFNELSGLSENKPFECVGTVDEVNIALIESIKRYKDVLPFLLSYYKQSRQYEYYRVRRPEAEVAIEQGHFLPESFLNVLIRQLNESED